MSKDRPTDDRAQREGAKPVKPAVPTSAPEAVDERDLTIERLERALAEEKAHAVTLREANDAFRFKVEILEKSYSKQLADARQRGEAAAKELGQLKVRLAEFGTGGEDTLKKVSEMHAELLNITAERNQLRDQLARPDAARRGSYGGRADVRRPIEESSDTINAMIKNAGLQPKREGESAAGDGVLNARVKLEQGPSEEMVSPDLIFTKSDKDDDDEKSAA